ncbi:MAG: hypothetical protein A2Y94_05315 [Caldithrix sp. RBG_13_44_9]|nr:MAG: hypothetical protein A2Y94_05315 [Caldithrix sp. RBG_13_44_9]
MKTKINLTIDKELVSQSKEYARKKGESVSQLVEKLLRENIQDYEASFSKKWRGRFRLSEKDEERYKKLKQKLDL